MPNIFYIGAYRFFFYSDEGSEPAHVHIDEGTNAAKFWLNTGELARSRGFKGHELANLRKLVMQHKDELLEAWNVHFKRTI